MFHDSCLTNSRWMAAHRSGGVATGLPPEELVQLDHGEAGDLAKLTARVDLPAAPGPAMIARCTVVYGASGRSLEISPGTARLSAVVSVIGPVVTGVVIVTAAEHSEGRRRAWIG